MIQTERQVMTESLLDTNVLCDFANCMQVKKTDKLTEVMLILLCCTEEMNKVSVHLSNKLSVIRAQTNYSYTKLNAKKTMWYKEKSTHSPVQQSRDVTLISCRLYLNLSS